MLVGLLFLFPLRKSYVPVIRSSHGRTRREVTLYYAKDQQLVRSLGEHPFSPLTTSSFCSAYVLLMFTTVCGAQTVDRFMNFLRDSFELRNVLLHYRIYVITRIGYYKLNIILSSDDIIELLSLREQCLAGSIDFVMLRKMLHLCSAH